MTIEELRERLAACNLSLLSRLAGVGVRHLRRIRNGSGDVTTATIERLRPHIRKAKAKP